MIKIELKSDVRWIVKFRENNNWQLGLYRPEFKSKDEIDKLEKHDAPELFYLVEGEIILVLSKDGKEIKEVKMEKNKVYIVDEWHNAYSPRGDGLAIVIEKPNIKTEFLSIK